MLKKFKSWFIVEEEGAEKSTPTPEKKAPSKKATSTPTTNSGTPKSPATSTARAGKVSDKFLTILFKAMDSQNMDGFDYLEFKQSLQSLEKVQMDEATRFKSAFAMAGTMGADATKIIQSATHYLNVLKTEAGKFQNAVSNQMQTQVGDKQAKIKLLTDTVAEKQKQIAALEQQIAEHRKEIKSIEGQVSKATVKVENTKNDFQASYDTLVGQINQDVENMKQYLK